MGPDSIKGGNGEIYIINKDGEKETIGTFGSFSFTEDDKAVFEDVETSEINPILTKGCVSGTLTLSNDSAKQFKRFIRKIYFMEWIDTFKIGKVLRTLINKKK